MLIVSGIMLEACVAGMLMRPKYSNAAMIKEIVVEAEEKVEVTCVKTNDSIVSYQNMYFTFSFTVDCH